VTRRWLAPGVSLFVGVDDRSRFGSPLTTRPDEETRALFASVLDHVKADGPGSLAAVGPSLLREVVDRAPFGEIADRTHQGWRLHDDVLFPSGGVRFDALHVVSPGGASLALRPKAHEWPAVHELVADLHGSGTEPSSRLVDASTITGQLLAALDEIGGLVATPVTETLDTPGLTLLGHNTVVVRSARSAVVLDPFLPAWRAPSEGPPYRPLTVPELGPIDALVITHSHPDHFDPGTLLRFPCDTTVIVPRIERETLLAVAMGERLRQLGFSNVVELMWWESTTVGDIDVHALPFYGEQPTDVDWLHPDVRNAGNTYVVSTPEVTATFLADSGRDHLGDSRDLGVEASGHRVPTPDVVFSGYRTWQVYPAQHLLSSVARYVLFVPPSRWSGRMQLMNGFDEALDVAERWSSPRLVPYADGGAPWFWELGLGPRLDDAASEVSGFDPFPERAFDHARARSSTARGEPIASPVDITLLRPNDSLVGWSAPGGPHRARRARNSWPYDEPSGGSVR
jgi:L-ascorbate metabolism protein UlaG (beta-lactamase superfamily)